MRKWLVIAAALAAIVLAGVIAFNQINPGADPYWECMAKYGFHPEDDASQINLTALGEADEACG